MNNCSLSILLFSLIKIQLHLVNAQWTFDESWFFSKGCRITCYPQFNYHSVAFNRMWNWATFPYLIRWYNISHHSVACGEEGVRGGIVFIYLIYCLPSPSTCYKITKTCTQAGFMDLKSQFLDIVCHWLLWFCCSNLCAISWNKDLFTI